ncbi:ribosomal L32p protein family-domain-containing protein [Mycena floridula]|nr:ribosomal L32p protein family-domain-containing protein [Mycena floridula]
MASIALPQARLFRGVFSFASRPLPWLIPAQSIWELFPPFLLAVPKKKTSHSRKSMRLSNKGLKDKSNIVNCPACGTAKLAHHLCPNCYSFLSRMWKKAQRAMPDLS